MHLDPCHDGRRFGISSLRKCPLLTYLDIRAYGRDIICSARIVNFESCFLERSSYLAGIIGWDLWCGEGQQSGEVRNPGISLGIRAGCSIVR